MQLAHSGSPTDQDPLLSASSHDGHQHNHHQLVMGSGSVVSHSQQPHGITAATATATAAIDPALPQREHSSPYSHGILARQPPVQPGYYRVQVDATPEKSVPQMQVPLTSSPKSMLPSVKRSQSLTALTVNVVDDDEAEDGETELDPGYYGGQNPINTTATSRLIPLRTPSIPTDANNGIQASPRVSLLGPVRRLSSLWKGVLRYVWPRRTSPTRSREMHQQQRRDHRFLYRRIVTDPNESLSDGDCPDTDPSLDAIHSFFGESVIVSLLSCCCLCSLPVGLLAVYYSSKVDSLILRGKIDLAIRCAHIARILLWTAVGITITMYILAFIVILQLLRPL
ncbi:hypothetical protein BASA50_006472 [Batrachochytrium salamandrivorans]|uniref:Uncharacterized protein n=1 Tax=Batrachochytrium salamandrivorans TaxID=1357716 RepID=A0ABQ8F9J3_9FUNG|nr:hypothetical protein BASA50_006472 [Batrachochytrium salamandrivorans]